MDKKLLSYDPITGLETYFSHDESTNESTISYAADSSPILEANKKMANDADYSKKGIRQEFWHYASIPVIVQMKLLIEDGIDVYNKDHTAALLKKLDDPDYRYLKCTTGKHR